MSETIAARGAIDPSTMRNAVKVRQHSNGCDITTPANGMGCGDGCWCIAEAE